MGQVTDKASEIRWDLVPYMHGKALDLGCGKYKVFPHFIGVDVVKELWPDVCQPAEKLDLFADDSFDFVFSSHLLQSLEDKPKVLKEWLRVLKPGGHLAL